jgi:uncharacterized protein
MSYNNNYNNQGMYNPNPNQYNPYAQGNALAVQSSVLNQAYLWMTGGLCLTAVVAYLVSQNQTLVEQIFGSFFVWILFLAEIGLVFFISSSIQKIAPSTAIGLFLLYSALNGATLSIILLTYTGASIAATFFVTAGMFGATSLYGYTTKRDLTGIGSLAFMALIGILLASIVNIFLASSTLYWIITYLGVIIFVGLTAYDTQKIKQWSLQTNSNDSVMVQRLGILGALTLYLDFINMFLFILRIMGRRQ